ncbi:hypothetical protein BDQ12DRAFT_671219 [Crucibulum laeve]|uniref:Uncharacterized protein n=1 Tax=Crucibulum laeve TaxID=68775 RepID=A0A5C3LGK2_9AGAR|nr:hypothetical protein BDQ12DRAFT_671219 [Crucibulum laeve]
MEATDTSPLEVEVQELRSQLTQERAFFRQELRRISEELQTLRKFVKELTEFKQQIDSSSYSGQNGSLIYRNQSTPKMSPAMVDKNLAVPQEIVDIVVDQLQDDPKALIQCSLVAPSWVSPGIDLLSQPWKQFVAALNTSSTITELYLKNVGGSEVDIQETISSFDFLEKLAYYGRHHRLYYPVPAIIFPDLSIKPPRSLRVLDGDPFHEGDPATINLSLWPWLFRDDCRITSSVSEIESIAEHLRRLGPSLKELQLGFWMTLDENGALMGLESMFFEHINLHENCKLQVLEITNLICFDGLKFTESLQMIPRILHYLAGIPLVEIKFDVDFREREHYRADNESDIDIIWLSIDKILDSSGFLSLKSLRFMMSDVKHYTAVIPRAITAFLPLCAERRILTFSSLDLNALPA